MLYSHADKGAQTIEQLNSFLRGELSAVESYNLALQRLAGFLYRATLEDCANSHERRALMLAREVARRGGSPAQNSGTWGKFVRVLESSSIRAGAKHAVAALEEGEDHGRNDYDRDIEKLDVDGRSFVAQRLMPEQIRTHGAMSYLKKRLHSGPWYSHGHTVTG
jgi:hypothetical protein